MLPGARDALFTCQPLPRPGRTFLPALRPCGLLAPSCQACFLGAGSSSCSSCVPEDEFPGVLLSLSWVCAGPAEGASAHGGSVRRQSWEVSEGTGTGNGSMPGSSLDDAEDHGEGLLAVCPLSTIPSGSWATSTSWEKSQGFGVWLPSGPGLVALGWKLGSGHRDEPWSLGEPCSPVVPVLLHLKGGQVPC